MRHWRSLIERDYLGAWDLVDDAGNPRDVVVEITAVESVSLKTREVPKGKRKCVIRFRNAQKAMVCNTTNAETIERMYGSDVDQWVGKRIALYQGDVRSPKGGTIKGVCVRPRPPTGRAGGIVSRPVDETMRAEQDAAFERSAEREPGEEG